MKIKNENKLGKIWCFFPLPIVKFHSSLSLSISNAHFHSSALNRHFRRNFVRSRTILGRVWASSQSHSARVLSLPAIWNINVKVKTQFLQKKIWKIKNCLMNQNSKKLISFNIGHQNLMLSVFRRRNFLFLSEIIKKIANFLTNFLFENSSKICFCKKKFLDQNSLEFDELKGLLQRWWAHERHEIALIFLKNKKGDPFNFFPAAIYATAFKF